MSKISKNQIDKLGNRLLAGEIIEDDADLLERLNVLWNSTAHEVATAIEHSVSVEHFSVSARAKNVGTIRAKLHRQKTLKLSYMRDLAGCRMVVKNGREDQQIAASEVVRTFSDHTPKYVNRITDPRVGYRAVHVALNMGSTRVEVQIRTQLQHAWAEFMEQFGDVAGRDLRYEDDFEFGHLAAPERMKAVELRDSLLYLAELIDEYEVIVMRITDGFDLENLDRTFLVLARVRLRLALNREIKALSESHKQQLDRLEEALR